LQSRGRSVSPVSAGDDPTADEESNDHRGDERRT
jgi:hypothetical protein